MRQIQVDNLSASVGSNPAWGMVPTDVCYKYGQAERLFMLRDIEGRLYEHCLQANFQ